MTAPASHLDNATSHDHLLVEPRVATKHCRRFKALQSNLYESQTNVWVLYNGRGYREVSPWSHPKNICAQACDQATRARQRTRNATPSPLPPTGALGGVSQNFSSTFPRKG